MMHRLTGGVVGSTIPFANLDVLLLTTRGRRSGKLHTTPVAYFRQGDSFVVIASNRGNDRYPQWYWNLQFNTQATILIGSAEQTVFAKEARADERRFMWSLISKDLPVVGAYQKRTPRELPIVLLHPIRATMSD